MNQLKQFTLLLAIIVLSSCNSTNKTGEHISVANLAGTITPIEPRLITKPVDEKIWIEKVFPTIQHTTVSNPEVPDTTLQTPTSLADDFNSLAQELQEFTINPEDSDTTIVCKEGTILKIVPQSFLLETTQAEVKEIITLQVKEFYKTSDILLAGLSTHSDSNILETGGMLFIQVVSNGQLCKLKDSATIEITFPFAQQKDNMLLFSGNQENKKINWIKPTMQKDSIQQGVDEIAVYPGGDVGTNNFFQRILIYPDSLAEAGIGGSVEIDFIVDETGTARDVNFKISSHRLLRDAVLTALPKMLRWKPAKRNGLPVKSTVSQVITFVNEKAAADTDYKTNFETTVSDSNIIKKSIAQIRGYIFSTSKLGWMNCDRFYKTKKARTDFDIDCGDYTNLDVKLVFHTFKGILADYTFSKICKFRDVPVDEPVTIVIVKKVNNQTFISLTESNTTQVRVNNLQFEQVTMDGLEQKLERLNVLGN